MAIFNDLPLWQDKNVNEILEGLCNKHGVPIGVLKDLVNIEREHQHKERAHGIYDDFDNTLSKMD
jgi:hypothetical protein